MKTGSQGAARDDLTPPKSSKRLRTHTTTRSEDYEEHDFADHVADYEDEPTFLTQNIGERQGKEFKNPLYMLAVVRKTLLHLTRSEHGLTRLAMTPWRSQDTLALRSVRRMTWEHSKNLM